jgi:hypothetical protein
MMPTDAEILYGTLVGDGTRPNESQWLYIALLHTGEIRLFTWDGAEWVRRELQASDGDRPP